MRPCIQMEYPEFSGCYALIKDGLVIYVGQSKNVLYRVAEHKNRYGRWLRNKGPRSDEGPMVAFDVVRLYPCPKIELNALEAELMALYRPAGNKIAAPRDNRKVDIAALCARANVSLEEWRTIDTRTYSPSWQKNFRRV